ncbi:uncharacterized protein At1g01500-like [Hibiscus syriacus]|uniref:uncharacterized protein At1g01500-like n=1 Tax=Hibiscus syriacus TaxID=106335 RepID=UPI001923C1FE|nr:uncharacterized protein At1g01500-like [Hibiscus syriacus]
MSNFSAWLEIRLFYFRIAPCLVDSVPDHLTLCYLCREIGFSLEIPASDSASFTLRHDRLNRESSKVTYVSTDSVRVTGGFEFEVHENGKMMPCGSLERIEGEWSMKCYMAAAVMEPGNSVLFQLKMGFQCLALKFI